MKQTIEGKNLTLVLKDIPIKNSNMYNLLFSVNSQENIKAEIERMEAEIILLQGFMVLKNRLNVVMSIINSCNENYELAATRLTKEFEVTPSQAQAFLELSYSEIVQTDYELVQNGLHSILTWFKDFYRMNFDKGSF